MLELTLRRTHRPPPYRLARAAFPVPRAPLGNAEDVHLRALATLLCAWLDIPDWAQAGTWLAAHAPELCDILAIGTLSLWIRRNEATADAAARMAGDYLRWHRRVLWRARRQGAQLAWQIERAGW
jgi:hypothetical protein